MGIFFDPVFENPPILITTPFVPSSSDDDGTSFASSVVNILSIRVDYAVVSIYSPVFRDLIF